MYSFGVIFSSSCPVAINVEDKDQITSASGVSENAEVTVTELVVKVPTGFDSTLTESDQNNCTKLSESSFTLLAFSWVSIEAPDSSRSTKSPNT